MARRRKLLVPEARDGVDQLQTEVMSEALGRNFHSKEEIKVELAKQLDVPYHQHGSNGDMRAEDAGKIGGSMGGKLVQELVRMSLKSLSKNR